MKFRLWYGREVTPEQLEELNNGYLETNSGIKISPHFIDNFFDSLDGAVLLRANGERLSFNRKGDSFQVTLAGPNGTVDAPEHEQPTPAKLRLPDLDIRGPRRK